MSNVAMKVIVTGKEEETKKQVQELEARLKELKKKTKAVSFKIHEFKHPKTGDVTRGIQVNGITAKPMFLYGSQALAFVQVANDLREFVEANRKDLSWKE